ncbi:MAG: carboxypeptidase regulatory-like domain-containing protein [Polyangiales bacterium]
MACTRESGPAASTPPAAATSPPSGATASAGPSSLGIIVGTVVTEPFNAIKKGAVVYLEDGPKEAGEGMSAALDNHDMTFVPFITVITAGGTVTFGNTDPFPHNAFSSDGEGWDIGSIPTHGAIAKTFEKPNFYSVLCNLHKSMLAYIVVTPSSYFAKTDADGKFTLGAPPGTYKVTAWSPRLKPMTKPVTVTTGEVTLNFDLAR